MQSRSPYETTRKPPASRRPLPLATNRKPLAASNSDDHVDVMAATAPAAAETTPFMSAELRRLGGTKVRSAELGFAKAATSRSTTLNPPAAPSSADQLGFAKATISQGRPPAAAPSSGRPQPVNGLDAVLFLDVDGVLHPPNPKHERLMFRASCMELLREVCQQVGCKIVLSTTWRLHEEGRNALAAKLAEHGCPQFVSRTPSIAQFQRPKEILAWVSKHKPAAWVAVDDWPLHEDQRMEGHFVQTRNRYGLQPDTAARIAALFHVQGVVAK